MAMLVITRGYLKRDDNSTKFSDEVTGKVSSQELGTTGIMIHPASHFLRLYHLGPEKFQEYSSQKNVASANNAHHGDPPNHVKNYVLDLLTNQHY